MVDCPIGAGLFRIDLITIRKGDHCFGIIRTDVGGWLERFSCLKLYGLIEGQVQFFKVFQPFILRDIEQRNNDREDRADEKHPGDVPEPLPPDLFIMLIIESHLICYLFQYLFELFFLDIRICQSG